MPTQGYRLLPEDPSMALHFDASRLLGANFPLPSDGTSVTFAFDLSGNNSHFTSRNAARQPLFKTNIQNGLPGILFQDSNDVLENLSCARGLDTTKGTIFTVGTPADTTSRKTVYNFYPLVSNATFLQMFLREVNNDFVADVPTSATTATGVVSGNYSAIPGIWYHQYSSAGQSVYWNGVLQGSGTVATTYQIPKPMRMLIGANRLYGSAFLGYLHEFIIYDRVLSASEITTVQNYLKWKWGISF